MKVIPLSEAIILGDTLKKCDPMEWLSEDGSCGCALGGALLAAGITTKEFRRQLLPVPSANYSAVAEIYCIRSAWPWLRGEHLEEISELYFKVAVRTKTIEDIAAYVRTIEPAEDPELSEQYRAEEEAAAEEGALIEASGYRDPADDPRWA